MTINFLTEPLTAGRHEGTSAEYPWGTFQDKTGSGNNGTPVSAAHLLKDWDGFRQYLLSKNKVTPSGAPDTALSSDIADALYSSRESRGFRAYHQSASVGSESDYPQSQMNASAIQNDKGQGASYRPTAALTNGGVYYGGPAYPGDSSVTNRIARYDLTGDLVFEFATISNGVDYSQRFIVYNPVTKVQFVGVPNSAKIHRVAVEMRNDGFGAMGADLAYKVNYTGTWPELDTASGLWSEALSYSGQVSLIVEFDPTDID